jgi:MFS family permease
VGGVVADRADRHSSSARVLVGAVGTLSAAVLTFFALRVDPNGIGVFVMLFGVGWLLQYLYFTSKFPAIADVVPPGLRSTAIAVASATSSLMGGALGPVFAGGLSDAFARTAAEQGATSAQAAAEGLRQSLAIIVPISLLIAAIGLFLASITVGADNARLKASMTAAIHDED